MSFMQVQRLLAIGLLPVLSVAAHASDIPPLEALFKGTYQAPPKSAPKPDAGKKVWIIPCGQELVSCAVPADAMVEAAKSIGWTATIFDGKLDPAVAGDGIRQAIAAKYDAVLLYAVDCAGVKQPLVEAKRAGLKIVSGEGLDCSDTDPNDKPLFDSSVSYVEGAFPQYDKDWGRWQAYYAINSIGEKAEVINFFTDEVQSILISSEGVQDVFKSCPGCKVDNVKFSLATLGPQMQQQAEQAILRFPKAKGTIVPSDGVTVGGVGAAAAASSRKLFMVGGEGQAANLDLVRQGGKQEAGGVGIPGRWEAYAEIDDLNRVFHGQKPESSGIGLQVFDATHNLPASGAYVPPVDFVAAYRKIWGVAP